MKAPTGTSRICFYFLLLILVFSSLPISFGAPTAVSMGSINVTTQNDAVAIFSRMLAQDREAIYEVHFNNKMTHNLDINQAMNDAYKGYETTRLFFRSGSYMDKATGNFVCAIGKADWVINNFDEFKQFLANNKGSRMNSTTLKLNQYNQNGYYPYPTDFGFDGTYHCSDVGVNNNAVLRTITRNVSADLESVKTYRVSSDEEAKAALKDAIVNFYEKITLEPTSPNLSFDLGKAYDDLNGDFTEISFSTGIFWTTVPNQQVVSISYYWDSATCKALFEQGMRKADSIIAAIIRPNMDDYDKILALHDYVLEHTTYDNYAYHFKLSQERVGNFLGPLLDGRGVCSGYTSTMKVLLDKLGIQNKTVVGTTTTSEDSGLKDHAWNIVYLDGQPYHLDATWDDSSGWWGSYSYFLISDQALSKNHNWIRTRYVPCSMDYKENLPGEQYASVLSAQGQFFAVGTHGKIVSSKDGKAWTTHLSNTQSDLKSIAYGHGQFLAVGSEHTLVRSSDGTHWNSSADMFRGSLNKIVFAGNRFFVVGDNGFLASSADGSRWMILNSGTNKHLYDLAYNGIRYVTVGQEGVILTSTDSIRWTAAKSSSTDDLRAIAVGSGGFLTGGSSNSLLRSVNGTIWQKTDFKRSLIFNHMIFAQNRYMAVGNNEFLYFPPTAQSYYYVHYNRLLNGLAFDGQQFVAAGSSSALFASKNSDMTQLREVIYALKHSK